MLKQTTRFFLIAVLLLYLLPAMAMPFLHLDLDFSGDEGPANCPGCFLASQGLLSKLPTGLLLIPTVVVEERVEWLEVFCVSYFGLSVKAGGNKSPPLFS